MGNGPRERTDRKTLPYDREVLAQLNKPEHRPALARGTEQRAPEPKPKTPAAVAEAAAAEVPVRPRAMTIEDPLTTQLLAQIAREPDEDEVVMLEVRARGTIDIPNKPPATPPTPTHSRAVRRNK